MRPRDVDRGSEYLDWLRACTRLLRHERRLFLMRFAARHDLMKYALSGDGSIEVGPAVLCHGLLSGVLLLLTDPAVSLRAVEHHVRVDGGGPRAVDNAVQPLGQLD